MSFDALRDFANQSNREIGDFRLNFILSPDKMRGHDYGVEDLIWDSIHFGDDAGIERIPNDKRGVYALTICHPSRILPPHGYVIYIGIAGRRSNRPLRERYRDYLRG